MESFFLSELKTEEDSFFQISHATNHKIIKCKYCILSYNVQINTGSAFKGGMS